MKLRKELWQEVEFGQVVDHIEINERDPEKRAKAIVEAVNHWNDPKKLVEISTNLGESMK